MTTQVKRHYLLLALMPLAFVAVSCGGNGSFTPPPPPPSQGNFSNASLSGQYAFSMVGSESCAGMFTRAGSFTADGQGHITTGLEDVNLGCTGTSELQFTGGTYSISGNGRGTLQLTNSTGTTNYAIALSSTSEGFIAQVDVDSTASGSFQKQNPAAFSNAAIAGGYVFDFRGLDSNLNSASYVGRFDVDATGNVSNGLFDSNIAGTPSGQQFFPSGAFLQLDSNGNGTKYGRGTANIAGQLFAFYVVDATTLKLNGIDATAALQGDAFAQQNIAFTNASLNGSFAFLIAGSAGTGTTAGPITTAGRFTADGAGNLSIVALDENNSGSLTQLPNGTVTGSYAVDASGGGGTMSWSDSNVGSFSFIFYLISPTQAVFQETDSSIVSDGTFSAQTATPITAASMAGDYVLGWSGISSAEEDYVGQVTFTSSGSFSGLTDVNEFSTSRLFDVPVSGNLALTGDGTQFNDFTANLPAGPGTLKFTAYVVNQNTVFLVGIDGNRVIAGSLARQP